MERLNPSDEFNKNFLESSIEYDSDSIEIQQDNLERRKIAEQLANNNIEVNKILETLGNNYEKMEKYYRKITGSELTSDPYGSIEKDFPIKKTTISIVIPAYNNGERLQKCLLSIEGSTFNAKCNDKLEVIVVDDGSTNGENHISGSVQELIDNNLLKNLNIKVVRQPNGGAGKARFTGVNLAQNEYIIFHDPDIVENPNLIEEYAKRFEVLDNIAMFGPRGHIEQNDPKIRDNNEIKNYLPRLPIDIQEDGRWTNDHLSDCDNLKKLTDNQNVWVDHGKWNPYSFFWGLNVAMKKKDLLKHAVGYDPRIKGWGAEDDITASQVLSSGVYAIPCPSAFCHHIKHPININEEKRQENVRILQNTLNSPPKKPLEFNRNEIIEKINMKSKKQNLVSQPTTIPDYSKIAAQMLKTGFYETADKYSEMALKENPNSGWNLSDRAMILLEQNKTNEAFQLQEKAENLLTNNPYIFINSAKLHARVGNYEKAYKYYENAISIGGVDFLKENNILIKSAQEYKNEGTKYLKEKKFRKALNALDMCLTLNPNMMWAEYDKAHALMELNLTEKAYGSAEKCNQLKKDDTWVLTLMGKLSIKLNNSNRAKKELNRALELCPSNQEAKELLENINL